MTMSGHLEQQAESATRKDKRDQWTRAVIRVGDGRGFVVAPAARDDDRLVITAAHCLPDLPPFAFGDDAPAYRALLGPLGGSCDVSASCHFVDPVADLAVLCRPEEDWPEEDWRRYSELTEAVEPLPIGSLPLTREDDLGPPRWEGPAQLLSLDNRWFCCKLLAIKHTVCIRDAFDGIEGGMSGSPIVSNDGAAVGLVSQSHSTGDGKHTEGPGPNLALCLPARVLYESRRGRHERGTTPSRRS